ncbi:MAG: hypothetical protein Q9174_006839 [Haloplaca sp. 1 TL-2023]
MSSYYTSVNQRYGYPYGGNYGQQPQQNGPDAAGMQNRTPSTFGTSASEQASLHSTSQPQQAFPGRYGQPSDMHNSGSSTPNPSSLSGQPQQGQGPQVPHQQQQPQGQSGGPHGGYPYGHPYYPSPYYQAYMNQVSNHAYGRDRPMFDDVRRYDDQYLTHAPQFGYGGNQGGYGGPFGGAGGKQGMYGQPHQGYGMNPQSAYDQHAPSPANLGGFGGQHSAAGRESAGSANVSNFHRTGSTQPAVHQQQQPGVGSGGYGGMSDAFGRSTSGFQGQAHGLAHQQPGGQHDDSLRGFGDASKMQGTGPSPAPPGARPGSAVNNLQAQAGLPPSQNQSQQGYGGYPGHMNHQMHGGQGSQYGAGPGGLGAHHQSAGQGHQGSGYGGYGAGFGGNYYGNNNRGGWAGNYGH